MFEFYSIDSLYISNISSLPTNVSWTRVFDPWLNLCSWNDRSQLNHKTTRLSKYLNNKFISSFSHVSFGWFISTSDVSVFYLFSDLTPHSSAQPVTWLVPDWFIDMIKNKDWLLRISFSQGNLRSLWTCVTRVCHVFTVTPVTRVSRVDMSPKKRDLISSHFIVMKHRI